MDHSLICRQILDVSLGLRPGQRVWINGWTHSSEFVARLSQECEKRKCKVLTTLQSEASWLRSLTRGPIDKLEKLSRRQKAVLDETDAYIFTLGPRRLVRWDEIPPKRRRLATIWLLEQNSFAKEWRSITAQRGIKMLGLEATLATKERARALGINFQKYNESMWAGCTADCQRMSKLANKISSILGRKSSVRITTPAGTELQFALDDRPVEASDGIAKEQDVEKGRPAFLPAGGVGTTVDEESARGTIYYDQPIRTWKGPIQNLTLEVKGGKVVRYRSTGEIDAFKEFLEASPGSSGRFAFLGFGLNPLLRPGYTQDDKVLGSVELNFGENKSRGGKNEGTGGFWGTVSKASVSVGSRQIMKTGKLLV